MVDVIHDGNVLPTEFSTDAFGQALLGDSKLPQTFIEERDWGAELVASKLASALHLNEYFRVTTARALLDFGRFPGITTADADHLNRYAINFPFSQGLSHVQKRKLLRTHYDVISEGMDQAIRGKQLKIAIHTYDKRNPSKFERPAVSILTRPLGHQHLSCRPFPHFDPAFPAKVIEYTADRLLRSRIAQTLEEASIHTADNFPYSLPEGSVEVRAQVWYFSSMPEKPIRALPHPVHSRWRVVAVLESSSGTCCWIQTCVLPRAKHCAVIFTCSGMPRPVMRPLSKRPEKNTSESARLYTGSISDLSISIATRCIVRVRSS